VDDAKAHEMEDEERRKLVEQRNQLDQLIYRVERTMNEAKEKLPVDLGREVSTALEDARTALKKENDVEGWKAAEEKLMATSTKMAEHLYKSASGGPTPGDPGAGGPGAPPPGAEPGKKKDDDNVIDADWSEAN
jgi:molecular chaperone DnaK